MQQLNDINPPDVVCGVHSLRGKSRKDEDELELEKMLKESEALLAVLFLLMLFFL